MYILTIVFTVQIICRNIDQYAMVSCGVLEEYGRQGIGSQLMERVLIELQRINIKLVYGDFSNIFSQRIATKCGFEIISRQKYEEHHLNYHIMPEHVKKLHKENWAMIKRFF